MPSTLGDNIMGRGASLNTFTISATRFDDYLAVVVHFDNKVIVVTDDVKRQIASPADADIGRTQADQSKAISIVS